MFYPPSLQALINEFLKLPGLGQKTAQRFIFHLLSRPKEDTLKLINALQNILNDINFCSLCHNITQKSPCHICSDIKRDKRILCIVSKPQDVPVIENTGEFHGLYHVLGGHIDPIDGTKGKNLSVDSLIQRIKKNNIQEVILAFNPDIEGETTSLYIFRLLKEFRIKISRLARGLPMGADLEYADDITLKNAIRGRREI